MLLRFAQGGREAVLYMRLHIKNSAELGILRNLILGLIAKYVSSIIILYISVFVNFDAVSASNIWKRLQFSFTVRKSI